MGYRIDWTDGSSEPAETHDQAAAIIRERYGDAEVGHCGDLPDGGDRTLAWASPEDADDDSGAKACAVIRHVPTEDDEPSDECIYCGATLCGDLPPVPALGDDRAWTTLAADHASGCDWTRTRAHRIDG